MRPLGWELKEHWWNRNWGTAWRRDVHLYTDGVGWYVVVRRGLDRAVLSYPDETPARMMVTRLLTEYGPWTRLYPREVTHDV